MTSWKTYRLGELVKVKGGKRLPKGISLQTTPNTHPYIRIRDMGKKRVLELDATYEYVDDVTQKSIARYVVDEGDILLSIVGTIGLVSIVGKSLHQANQTENCVKLVNLNGIDPLFLYYFLLSPKGQDEIKRGTVGAVQAKLPIKNIENIDIPLPPMEEQRRIAGILGAIDDKIENNRRINTNLELQAQAPYKQWFVDFEFPNEEGKPYKSSGGKMVDSGLGLIPEGWSVGKLEDIGDIIGGGTPSKVVAEYYTKNGIAWITPKDLSVSHLKFTAKGETDITELGYKNSSAKIMPRGSVLFSSRAPIGYISIAKNDICTNQGFKSVVPNNGCTAFVYYFLLSNTENIESKATGSTFKEASGALMKSLELVIPSDDILEKFEKIMSPIFESQEKFEVENETLATLRDTLLPKLMSGELKVLNNLLTLNNLKA